MPRKPRLPPNIGGNIEDVLKERSAKQEDGEANRWRARLHLAKELRGERISVYDRNEQAYYGKMFDDREKNAARINQSFILECNLLLPTIASQRQRIVPRIPWHRLNGTRKLADLDKARMRTAEMTLNFLFRHPKMNYHSRMQQTHLLGELGLGAVEVYFSPDEGENPEQDKQEFTAPLEAAMDPKTGLDTLDSPGGDPLMTDDGQFVRRGDDVVIDTRNPLDYFGTRNYHWRDIIVDPEGDEDPESLGWIGTRFSMRLDRALKNPAFNKATKQDIRSAAKSLEKQNKRDMIRKRQPAPYESMDPGYGTDEEDFLRVTGFRIWDAVHRQNVYLIDGMPNVAGKLTYPGWIDHSPITFLKFEDRVGEFYPQTACEHGLHFLKAYALFWATLVNHLKRFKRKYGRVPNAFDNEQDESKFLDPIDGLVVSLRDKNALWPIDDAYLDPAIYRMMAYAEQNWFRIMGSASEFLGVPTADSATQASIIDRRGTGLEDEKRGVLIGCFEQVADKMLANVQSNLPKEIAVRIAGPDGITWKQMVGRADLGSLGMYKTSIDLTEMTPFNQQGHFQELLGFLQIMGPDAFAASPQFAEEFFKSGLMHNPDIADEFVEYTTLMLAQRLYQGGQQQQQGQGKPPKKGSDKGGYKPTGQGKEGGAATEGRSAGRQGREAAPNTLLGAGNTPAPTSNGGY